MLSLMYHDAVADGYFDSSGNPGADAAAYKITVENFAAHLDAIEAALRGTVGLIEDSPDGSPRLLLTFDDGGRSAWEHIAPLLEKRHWHGHFFMTTDRIGSPAFLTPEQIRDLDRRGHAVGSHSCSHPTCMSDCSPEELRREWEESVRVLSEILGKRVALASLPGGYYSRQVGEAAARAGIRTLFVSAPTTRIAVVNGCRIVGRFAIKRDTPASVAASLAAGSPAERYRQAFWWKLKAVPKAVARSWYLKRRQMLIDGGR